MATDLQSQLEAVLRGIEERMPHSEDCRKLRSNRDSAYPVVFRCNCDYGTRVRAEQARAVERMVEAGAGYTHSHLGAGKWKRSPDWAAVLRAVACE